MNYMIPTDNDTIELVAKAIARNRIHKDTDTALINMTGMSIQSNQKFEESFDDIFELLWNRNTPEDNRQKEEYRDDARAAISALNLKLVTAIS